MTGRVCVRVGLAFALLTVLPQGASAAPAPDSVTFARLSAAASEQNRFRIVSGKEEFRVTMLRMDAESVAVRIPEAHPAVITTSDFRHGELRRASWSEIDRIDGMRSHSLQGALIGGLIGGLVGLGATALFEDELHDASDVAVLAIPIGAVLGGAVGGIVGSTTGWKRLYP